MRTTLMKKYCYAKILRGLIVAMESKAEKNEMIDPAVLVNYLKEIVLGE